MIEIVAATQRSQAEFWTTMPLGLSLSRFQFDSRISNNIEYNNQGLQQLGLPTVFNRRISGAAEDVILVFTHDDVWLDDYFPTERLLEAVESFDLIGVAGNQRIFQDQATWAFTDPRASWPLQNKQPTWDRENLSGAVAHGQTPIAPVSFYGPSRKKCKLLDGVFLAARACVLRRNGVKFYERLMFHFYDLDICREAAKKNLRIGTWPIAITHNSGGKFGGLDWLGEMDVYFEKWVS